MRKCGVALLGLGLLVASLVSAGSASARNLYFDLWCQDQGYERERCDERRAEDVAAFEDYWRAVEKYEERYFVERQDYVNFRDELNSLDEVARPGFDSFDPERSPRPN